MFKNCKNSDFILRLLTNFIPIFSKKNAILIHEGQLIEKIVFVKNGRLALQAALDLEEPEESLKHYLNKNFGDISDNLMPLSKYDSSNTNSSFCETKTKSLDIAKTVFESVVNTRTKSALTSEINESGIGKELGKLDYGGEDFEESNYQFISIINIAKNESYGVVFMSLTKPSPLSLRVKSKKAELLLLRKSDAMDISQRYPNIWMKYLKKSYFNILSIKNIAIKKIKNYIDGIEKKSKLKKPILKSKTNLNPYTIYKLKNEEFNDIKNIIKNDSNTKLRLKKAKTLAKKRIQNLKKNGSLNSKLNASPKKNFLSTTNFTSQFSSYNKNNFRSNIKKDNNSMGSNRGEEKKSCFSPMNKSNFASVNRLKGRNPRYPRKEALNQLKTEIKKLKNSKKYYKQLCQTLTQSKSISNFNLTSLKSDSNNKDFGFSDNINQNVNIFHSIKPNIINNITIKNNNQFICKSNRSNNESERKDKDKKKKKNKKEEKEEKEFSNELKLDFSESEGSEKKSYLDELEINAEIRIYYKAKYINIDNFTQGEFSKNEELRKQSLNFIKMFIEIEKKKKNKKIQTRSIKEKDKILNPYTDNYDFRYILTKINLDWRYKDSNLNTFKTINTKKEKISDRSYILSSNNIMDNSHDSIITLFKKKNTNIKSEYKKFKSKKTKNSNTMKKNLSAYKNKNKINSNGKNKTLNLVGDSKSKRGISTFLKLPTIKNTLNEWEQEIELSKSSHNIYDLNKTISINSEDPKLEKSFSKNNSINYNKSFSESNVFQFK